MQSDKAQVVFLISDMPLPDGEFIDNEIGVQSVLIIDAICVWSQKILIMHHTVMEANCPLSDIVSMPEMTSGLQRN